MNHSRPNITDTLKKCYPFWEKLTDTQREQLKTSSYQSRLGTDCFPER